VSPVVLKAMKKGNLKSFVSGERSSALWALLFIDNNIRKSKNKQIHIFKGFKMLATLD